MTECIRAGQEAWHRLSSGHTRQDWLLVGKACQLLRAEAMLTAHANRPEGRRYNQEFSDLLKANGFAAIDKATRSKLFFILDNIAGIEKWLATVPANKRLELNHPHTIWRAYQRPSSRSPTTPQKASHVEELKTSLIESQEENARLKREAERALRFTRQDTARNIAGVVFRMISPAKAREVARELNRLVREPGRRTTSSGRGADMTRAPGILRDLWPCAQSQAYRPETAVLLGSLPGPGPSGARTDVSWDGPGGR